MRPTDLTRALTGLLPTGRPVYLWGPPGVGKSSLVKQAAELLDLDLIDLRAVLLDPVDLRGLPSIHGDVARWLPPAFLPSGGRGVLFLDELAQAPPMVQAACMQLCLDRRCGEYLLPEGWTIVAASNRQEDRAGAHRLISPLLNRFIHLDLEVHTDDWRAWALQANIDPMLIAFISLRPELLFKFDPAANQRAFCTPRSWEFVNQVLPALDECLLHPVVAGCVGEGPAAELIGFRGIWRELPDLDDVLARPVTALVPSMKSPAVLYALSGALVARAKTRPDQRAAVATYAMRLPTEFAVLTFRDCIQPGVAGAEFLRLPGVGAWLSKHKALIAN